jgi:hypothetical protein
MNTQVLDIGKRRELLVAPCLIERLDGGARRQLHRPQPREVALVCDEPWETGGPGYVTVFQDGGKMRMYYRANPGNEKDDGSPSQVTCYAESDDGIRWRKPELGLFEVQGTKRNNIVWQGTESHNLSPFRDDNPDSPADARYKAVGCAAGGGLQPFASPDGIHWRKLGEDPLPLQGAFDSHNVVFWDASIGRYRAYWRVWRGEGDAKIPKGRDIQTAVSPDFLSWSEPTWLDYDPNRSGSPERDQTDDPSGDHHQLYTANVCRYPRAPHLLLAFPARYCDRGWTASTDVLPDRDQRRALADLNIKGGRPTRSGTVVWDTLLMAGRDGTRFHVWPEAFIRPGIQRTGSWFYAQAGCAWGMLETPSVFHDAPPELSFYVNDHARVEGPHRLRRHALRLDGFASVFAPLTGGTFTTRPLRFEGSRLEINFSSSGGGRLRVELQDPNGRPIPGFALEDCHLQYGDQLDRVVSWGSGADLSTIAGNPARLHVELKDADLFGFRFR